MKIRTFAQVHSAERIVEGEVTPAEALQPLDHRAASRAIDPVDSRRRTGLCRQGNAHDWISFVASIWVVAARETICVSVRSSGTKRSSAGFGCGTNGTCLSHKRAASQ